VANSIVVLVGPFPDWTGIARQAQERGWEVIQMESGAEAFKALSSKDVTAVVLPIQLRDGPAANLLVRSRAAGTRADFLILGDGSHHDGAQHGDRATLLEEGADEIFDPPLDPERIVAKLDRLRDRRLLIDDLGLIVRDPSMLEIFERILRIAPLKVTALITGESGTGKEMLAQAIHRASDRKNGPFVAVNVGALPENLLESELFGHERGAFTSADSRRIGRFELANGGTLFLDEIGEMSLSSQVNLLRVLEEEEFLRVGGSKKIKVDVRIVAATNRDLEEMVREGRFRRDLFYRLKVVQLDVPPLRRRREEIPVLARELASRAAARHSIKFPGFTKEAIAALANYEWPGNVRELKNLVDGIVALRPEMPVRVSDLPAHILHGGRHERALPAVPRDRADLEREFIMQSLLAIRSEVAALREMIAPRSMPPGILRSAASPFDGDKHVYAALDGAIFPAGSVRIDDLDGAGSLSLQQLERRAVERALQESGDNRRKAAQALGISERTLYRRIKQFGLAAEPDAMASSPSMETH
jgi:DNA-binding NtrC family response regulator